MNRHTSLLVVGTLAMIAVAVSTVVLIMRNQPPHATVSDLGDARVAVLGDSLIKASTDEIGPALRQGGFEPTVVNGINGIETIKRRDDLIAAITPPDGAQVLVVGLGTNNVHSASLVGTADIRAKTIDQSLSDLDEVLTDLTAPGSSLQCLIWLNVTTATSNDGLDTYGPAFNEHLNEWADRTNATGLAMRIADWDTYSDGRTDWFLDDQIHFSQAGQHAYADLIMASIVSCEA